MLGAIITIFVLFGMVRLLEKDRDDIDTFQLATVAVVPSLCVILYRVVVGLILPDPILMTIVPPILLIALTFGLLWKHLEIPLGRSVLYTVVVIVVNIGLGWLLAPAQ